MVHAKFSSSCTAILGLRQTHLFLCFCLLNVGHLMDIKVLQECVRANVGDLTFEEAYERTKRILNISVSSSRTLEVPELLNYLTAPNVVRVFSRFFATFGVYPRTHHFFNSSSGVLLAARRHLSDCLEAATCLPRTKMETSSNGVPQLSNGIIGRKPAQQRVKLPS